MDNFGARVAFIGSVADLLRDAFKRSKHQDVILPLTVLRRIDRVLEPTKERVLAVHAELKGKLDNPRRNGSGRPGTPSTIHQFIALYLRTAAWGYSPSCREPAFVHQQLQRQHA